MAWSVMFAIVWVFGATACAFLPMRRQYVPGVTLLILAPVLIIWLGFDFGWVWAVIALLAFGSMFRNPLRYFYARARGRAPELPR